MFYLYSILFLLPSIICTINDLSFLEAMQLSFFFSYALGWVILLLTNSILCGWESVRRLVANKLQQQHSNLFIFSLNRWLISAYTNGLTAQLNMMMVWTIENMTGLNLRLVVSSTVWSITSGSQVIPNMALTVTIIKVTRFRTLSTPCVKKQKPNLQVKLKFAVADKCLLIWDELTRVSRAGSAHGLFSLYMCLYEEALSWSLQEQMGSRLAAFS